MTVHLIQRLNRLVRDGGAVVAGAAAVQPRREIKRIGEPANG